MATATASQMPWRRQSMSVWPSPTRWGAATTGSRPTAWKKAYSACTRALPRLPGGPISAPSSSYRGPGSCPHRSDAHAGAMPTILLCGETCRLGEGGGAQLGDQLREPAAHLERPLLGGHRWPPWDEARLLGRRHVLADGLAVDPERRRSTRNPASLAPTRRTPKGPVVPKRYSSKWGYIWLSALPVANMTPRQVRLSLSVLRISADLALARRRSMACREIARISATMASSRRPLAIHSW